MKGPLTPAVFILALCPLLAQADDKTYELLRAPLVRDQLRLQLAGDRGIQYSRDRQGKFLDLEDGATFVMREQSDLVFRDFNPFEITISTTESTEKDPNFASIARFIDAAVSFGGVFESTRGERGEPGTTANQKLLAVIDSLEQTGAATKGCDEYKALNNALGQILTAAAEPVLTAEHVELWSQRAAGRNWKRSDGDDLEEVPKGALRARLIRKEVGSKVTELEENVQLIERIDKAIHTRFSKSTGFCQEMHAATFADIYELSRRLGSTLTSRRQLVRDLSDLHQSLARYEDPAVWRSDQPNDYIVFKPTPDFENIKIVGIDVTRRSFDVKEGALVIAELKPISRSIRLRKYTTFVPEIGAAVIHSDLEYPRYATEQTPEGLRVKLVAEENVPYDGAVQLNLIWRCWGDSFAYPALQLGVSSAKEYPALLLGVGVRFTRPAPLMLVGGFAFTWFEELDSLREGDLVKDQAALEGDLERQRAPTAVYFGIQYNF